MQFTAEELDLIANALRYTIEFGYTFQDDPDTRNEYENLVKLLDKVVDTWIKI
jgi:hypothetical protein